MMKASAAATPAPSAFALKSPGAELAIVMQPVSAAEEPWKTVIVA
jgi:hypothetical protein